jgi:hypothetical protein
MRFHAGIADGSITLAFRRWKRPTVKQGGTLTTPVGVLGIDEVSVLDSVRAIGDADAHRAGFDDRAELLTFLAKRSDPLYRVRFHLAGADPRIALREAADLTEDDRAAIATRLARLDRASPHGPWTDDVLRLIAAQPGVRAGDLAASLGREREPFKVDVRKLKALGLTESLEVGYRLSPRGRAWLGELGRAGTSTGKSLA